MVHHLQPGRTGINCFDAGGTGHIGRDDGPFRHLLSLLLVCTDDPLARWALSEQLDGPSDDLTGVMARVSLASGDRSQPPSWAVYERAARANWRSSWEDDASGVWVRGGHMLDQHDHQDRGHVSFTRRGEPILIEAGTPSYEEPEMSRLFKSGVGHNVLQLGTEMPPPPVAGARPLQTPAGWQQPHGGRPEAQAPVQAVQLDDAGGHVRLDAGGCYAEVASWERSVEWSVDDCLIHDRVVLVAGAAEILLFRWHLATDQAVAVEQTGEVWSITWASRRVELRATEPVQVSQTQLPDRTLPRRAGASQRHTCLIVQTAHPLHALTMDTCFA
jgi:hypothetical protein